MKPKDKKNVYQNKSMNVMLKEAVKFNGWEERDGAKGKNRADTELVEMRPAILPHENIDRDKQSC